MLINLNDAISYNSMVELKNVFYPSSSYHSKFSQESALIACALKSRKIVIIMLIPEINENKDKNGDIVQGRYMILRSIQTEMKPTSLIQISQRHIAVATGFLNDYSQIEVLNIFTGRRTSLLKHHSDMIDSMSLIDLNRYTQNKKLSLDTKKRKKEETEESRKATVNPYIKWLVTMGRDNKMVVWKLFDGAVMHTDQALPLFANMMNSKDSAETHLPVEEPFIKISQQNLTPSSPASKKHEKSFYQNSEQRSSIWMLSTHQWYFKCTES